jgi:hypothetical protein
MVISHAIRVTQAKGKLSLFPIKLSRLLEWWNDRTFTFRVVNGL